METEIRIRPADGESYANGVIVGHVVPLGEVAHTIEAMTTVQSCGHSPDIMDVLVQAAHQDLRDQVSENREWAERAEMRAEKLAAENEALRQTLALREGELIDANEQRDMAQRVRDADAEQADKAFAEVRTVRTECAEQVNRLNQEIRTLQSRLTKVTDIVGRPALLGTWRMWMTDLATPPTAFEKETSSAIRDIRHLIDLPPIVRDAQ